jgi:hypothetical protein
MNFWFEFLDICMSEQTTICHDYHRFKWQNTNIFLILTSFDYDSTLFLAY